MKLSCSVLHWMPLVLLSSISLSDAANPRIRGGTTTWDTASSLRRHRRAQDMNNNNNNMNMNNNGNENDNNQQANDDNEEEEEVITTATTSDEPANVPPGGAGAPPGSWAADGSALPGGAGATGSSATEVREECPTVVYTDVVIVGAGAAGIAAAARLQEEDPLLNYVILESTPRVGGRVRKADFGIPNNTWTVEDGANWIYGDVRDNPLLPLMEETGFTAPFNDYANYVLYGPDGLTMDPDLVAQETDRFLTAMSNVESDTEDHWQANHQFVQDPGVVAALAQHGWVVGEEDTVQNNLDYALQWGELDWHYAVGDTSIRFYPVGGYESLMVTDPRGLEFLLQTYFERNANVSSLQTSTRVLSISYDENIIEDKIYKARVRAHNGIECTDYIAQRVISTVSAGVISSGVIDFQPALRYSEEEHNPMKLGQYVKIFYQFANQFWDDAEMIRIVRDKEHRGHCYHWHNMNYGEFMPGSNMIRCEIVTEAFEELKGGQRDLSDATLFQLLDPLRQVYGAENVPVPLAVYVPPNHRDASFGYGSYAHWKVGYTFTQYAQFYGGMEALTPYCEHNGCNSLSEWILLFAGSASCYDQAETVHGAMFSGFRTANFVLAELGYAVDTDNSPCDVNWQWLS